VDKVANRNSWKTLPLPSQRAKLSVKRTFSEQEYNRLSVGFIPEEMEDKWFIFLENNVLFFHRSWTGVCIYEAHLDNNHSVKEVWVNRDNEQYGKRIMRMMRNY